ncbi:MAG: ABC transporter ATP-binding protein [Deltaproteobacteria bacterium]|nr:ABC transporter ATP-binding protein [Deltaproteobacteria bacterium]
MILDVKDIEVYYNNVILAIEDINISIEQGQIVSLLGANGAGKSTCLKAISGLLEVEKGRVTRGEIYFEGKRVDQLGAIERVKSGICLVAEGRQLLKTLTVEENLKVGSLIRKDSASVIKDDLERMYTYFPILKQRAKQVSETLSGGEQQMLVIARTIMMRPKLLLLDEPSLGLAPLIAAAVISEIHRINQELGTTILLVEQNAALALPISNKAYIITNGRVALCSTPEEMKKIDLRDYYLGRKRAAI